MPELAPISISPGDVPVIHQARQLPVSGATAELVLEPASWTGRHRYYVITRGAKVTKIQLNYGDPADDVARLESMLTGL